MSKMDEKEGTADDAKKRVFELKRKALPTIINTKSRVFAKRSAVEDAYKKKEPSHFRANIFKAMWGHDALAKRCVVRSAKTGTLKELTPDKKLPVEKHFEHYLNFYNDNPSVISYHMGKINDYANRAISGSRKKLKAMKEYPEIDVEVIEQIDDLIQL
ncbi:uncharacterized protein LOC111693296 [Trichogramma pretiosum]|uniref:uncharacterized protein LOC111693296 n=1 Tax=Trichogramma pretiosum TaxID=7493 RepID=UPI000C71C125|nr:uncharacterized protein LOC111693296 [Trichogramma pretiosum]